MERKASAPFFSLLVFAEILCLSQSVGKADANVVTRPARFAEAVSMATHTSDDLPAGPALAMQAAYRKLPMSFEKNVGQSNGTAKFLARGSGYTLFLMPAEAALILRRPVARPRGEMMNAKYPIAEPASTHAATPDVLRMKLVGANPAASIVGLDPLPGKSNYFIGNDPRKWRTDVANYARVRYREIYPGVDLIYYGQQRQLEWDFVLAPGADFRSIRFAVEGARKLRLDVKGNLLLDTAGGQVVLNPPVVYQESGGSTQMITANYMLGRNDQVSFELGAYDPQIALVIDPVLSYSTYLGGSGGIGEYADDIAVDASGSAYVTGETTSLDFPTKNPLPAPNNVLQGSGDAFVTKLSPAGNALVYSTYLGGTGDDNGSGIAVDASGSAYVTGSTSSSDFPTKNPLPAPNNVLHGGHDVFVTKLSPAGNALVYSTYLGGKAEDWGFAIAVDSSGGAYVTGETYSSDFPVKNPLPPPNNVLQGSGDAFVTKLSPAGNALVYSTYLGGRSEDGGACIAVDASGSAYVTGSTDSSDFPTKNPLPAPNNAFQGRLDAFVTKLSPAGNALVYSTFLGGSGWDIGSSIAVDASGSAYMTGWTESTDFPTKNPLPAPNNVLQGGEDVFVTKLSPAGNALVYSTFLGGAFDDNGWGIAVDAHGSAYVTGSTWSYDFPTKNPLPAPNNVLQGSADAFVAKLVETSGGGTCVSWAGRNLFLCSNLPQMIDPCRGQPFGTGCLPLIPFPPVCSFVDCPPCLMTGSWLCPPFELLFDNRGNDLRLNLVTQNGEPAGAIENLKEPLRVGERTFNQRIRFRAQPRRVYLLEVSMGPKTRMDVGYRLELLLRPDTSKEEPPKPVQR